MCGSEIVQIREEFQDDVASHHDDHVTADQLIESKHSFAPSIGNRVVHPEFQITTEWNQRIIGALGWILGEMAQPGAEDGGGA